MPHKIDREELRLLIREALREAMGAGSVPPPSRATGKEPAYRLDSGVLTEALLTKLATGHQKIVIGGEVVVTPLARDRARILKVEIVRQKP
jgi:hypothetical protein